MTSVPDQKTFKLPNNGGWGGCEPADSRGLASPLHVSVNEHLFGELAGNVSAPAVFLIMHAEFEPSALFQAARLYERSGHKSGHVLAQALRTEATSRRGSRDEAPTQPPTAQAPTAGTPSSPQIMMAKLQELYAGGLPSGLFKEFQGHNIAGWERMADYVLAREDAMLSRLAVSIGALAPTWADGPGDIAFSRGTQAALREVQSVARIRYLESQAGASR